MSRGAAGRIEFTPVGISTRTPLQRFFYVLRRFIPYMLPHWHKLVLILILAPIATAILAGAVPILTGMILDEAFPKKSFPLVVLFVALIFLVSCIEQVNNLAQSFVRFNVKMEILRRLGSRYFNHLFDLPISFHNKHPVGERIFRASIDIHDAAQMVGISIPTAAAMIVRGAITALLAILIDWRALIFVVVFMPPYIWFAQAVTTRLRVSDRTMRERRQVVTAQLQQTLAGVNVVQAYAQEPAEKKRYAGILSEYLNPFVRWNMFSGLNEGLVHPAGLASAFAFLSASLWGWFYITGNLTLGQWAALGTLVRNVLIPSSNMILYFQGVRRDMVAAERVLEVLDIPPTEPRGVGRKLDAAVLPRIEFRNVTFGFDPEVPVLKNVSFVIEPGSSVAFLGSSGSGKSTVLNLLLRLYDPQDGVILIDGVDLKTIQVEHHRRRFGVVLQYPQLFAGTVRENLNYGHRGATDDTGLAQALEVSDVASFVSKLPEGLDTQLSERSDVSGGQKQRLTIARALARCPDVLLLDEPFASLDVQTQDEICERLETYAETHTQILFTSHREVAATAESIIVLEGGVLAAITSGTARKTT